MITEQTESDSEEEWMMKQLLQGNFFSLGEHVVQQLGLMTNMLETQYAEAIGVSTSLPTFHREIMGRSRESYEKK
ncbi:hypothetical protein YC2023_002887 [Brassica napus]